MPETYTHAELKFSDQDLLSISEAIDIFLLQNPLPTDAEEEDNLGQRLKGIQTSIHESLHG